MIIKMPNKLRRMNEYSENFNKELQNIKRDECKKKKIDE